MSNDAKKGLGWYLYWTKDLLADGWDWAMRKIGLLILLLIPLALVALFHLYISTPSTGLYRSENWSWLWQMGIVILVGIALLLVARKYTKGKKKTTQKKVETSTAGSVDVPKKKEGDKNKEQSTFPFLLLCWYWPMGLSFTYWVVAHYVTAFLVPQLPEDSQLMDRGELRGLILIVAFILLLAHGVILVNGKRKEKRPFVISVAYLICVVPLIIIGRYSWWIATGQVQW